MFERFTDQARRAVLAAENEARALGNNFVSTEHLLLGLLDEADGEGLALTTLDRLGVDLAALRQRVLSSSSPVQGKQAAVLPTSPRVGKVYQLALQEALRFGHNHVGTEHLLLGLAREGGGVAAQVLAACGADEKHLRRQVVAALHGPPRLPARRADVGTKHALSGRVGGPGGRGGRTPRFTLLAVISFMTGPAEDGGHSGTLRCTQMSTVIARVPRGPRPVLERGNPGPKRLRIGVPPVQ